jgi:hypothetical protein
VFCNVQSPARVVVLLCLVSNPLLYFESYFVSFSYCRMLGTKMRTLQKLALMWWQHLLRWQIRLMEMRRWQMQAQNLVKQLLKRRSLIIFVEAYGQVKVPLFVAFTKKGLLPLPLRKSCRTKVTLRRVRRPPKKRDVGLEAPHLLAAVPLMSAAQ